MGHFSCVQTLPSLYKQLRANGLPADTPAVAVERGTTRDQRIVYAPMSELPGNVVTAGLRSPTLLIIGQVRVGGAWRVNQ